MITFPPCKINLGLNITAKRPDGYHDIVTCFYPVPWTDILEIIPAKQFQFSSSGNIIPGNEKDNLCVKAYELLRKEHSIDPVDIHLHKSIPTGAGLGGGSSDAAFTLTMVNDVFQLGLSRERLRIYAQTLGSDCAFFVDPIPKFATGRGEVLHNISVNLKGKFLIIVKPDVHVSTAEAYAGVTPSVPDIDLRAVLEEHPIENWKKLISNDFEKTVFKKLPLIKTIREKLYNAGALYASMSGSGSSVYGIFEASRDLRPEFAGMTFWSGYLNA